MLREPEGGLGPSIQGLSPQMHGEAQDSSYVGGSSLGHWSHLSITGLGKIPALEESILRQNWV